MEDPHSHVDRVYLVSLDVSILSFAFRDLVGDFGRDQERLLAVAMAGIYRAPTAEQLALATSRDNPPHAFDAVTISPR